jgi:hypothetical protein
MTKPKLMKHVESSIKIFFSKDYSLFRMINGNRQLNNNKIKRIRNDILKGLDVLRYCPILVKENKNTLEIIDGQHRYWVAKEMKSKVWYIVVEDFTLHDIAKINSNTEKWATKDYINCYIQQGNVHYQFLREFMEKTGFPLSVTLRLLATGKVGGDAGVDEKNSDKFKRGQFEVLFEKEANRMVDAVRQFEEFPGHNSRHFIIAIELILKAGKCDFVELVDKYKEGTVKLLKRESIKEYLANLEEIYNYRMRQRRVIY